MAYCKNCNTEIREGGVLCEECFKKFGEKRKEGGDEIAYNKDWIEKTAKEIEPTILEQWKRLRQNPELGEAPETSARIEEKLKNLGFEVEIFAKTGIVAKLKGKKNGPIIALKGNLDAMPVQDDIEDESIRSKIPKVSHTCGHAGEMAAMIGTAEIISRIPATERKTIALIFQPNEERWVKQDSYALKMVSEGALQGIDSIIEAHPIVKYPEGTFLSPEGRLNAASGRYKFIVHPNEMDVLEGRCPDANILLSLVITKMERKKSGGKNPVLLSSPYIENTKKENLETVLEKNSVPKEEFKSFKITLEGAGGHPTTTEGAINLTFLSAEIVSQLYKKYRTSLFSSCECIGKGEAAYNVLPIKIELWITIRGKDNFDNFQSDVQQTLKSTTKNLDVKSGIKEENIEDTPFALEAASLSTIRINEDYYFSPRKDIFSALRDTVEAEMKSSGLKKPPLVENAGEKMPCPEGQWRLYFQKGTPPQFNSPELIKIIKEAAHEFGITNFSKEPLAAGSDFSYMQEGRKTVLFGWGCIFQRTWEKFKAEKVGHHHPKFKEEEATIPRISKVLAQTILLYWEKNKK